MVKSSRQARWPSAEQPGAGHKSPIAVRLDGLRDVFLFPWPGEDVIKPDHCVAISGNHRSTGDVETQTAVLDGASDGSSQHQTCAGQGIQFGDQFLGIHAKYESETSRARLIIQLAEVLDVRASLIGVHCFTFSNFTASERYGSGHRRRLGPLEKPIGKGAVSLERDVTSVRDGLFRRRLIPSDQEGEPLQKVFLALEASNDFGR